MTDPSGTPELSTLPPSRWRGRLALAACALLLLIGLTAPLQQWLLLNALQHDILGLNQDFRRIPALVTPCLRGEPEAFARLAQLQDHLRQSMAAIEARQRDDSLLLNQYAHTRLQTLQQVWQPPLNDLSQFVMLERPVTQLATSLTRAQGALKNLAQLTEEFAALKLKKGGKEEASAAHELALITQQIGREALGLLVNNMGSAPTLQVARDLARFHGEIRRLKNEADTNLQARLMRIEALAEEAFAPLAWLEPLSQAGQTAERLSNPGTRLDETQQIAHAIEPDWQEFSERFVVSLALLALGLITLPLAIRLYRQDRTQLEHYWAAHEEALLPPSSDTPTSGSFLPASLRPQLPSRYISSQSLDDQLVPTQHRLAWLSAHVNDTEALALRLEQLASQASSLAVNASLEAARAGPQGHGIRAIAEEIQHFSDTSCQLAQQLGHLASGLRDGTQDVVDTLSTLRQPTTGSSAEETNSSCSNN